MEEVFEHDGWRAVRWVTGFIRSNIYLIVPYGSKEAVVIDAGGAARKVASYCRENGISLKHIILTHRHHDHTAAARRLKRLTGAKILASRLDRSKLAKRKPFIEGGESLEGGERIGVGGLSIEVIATPGHTPGGITLSIPGALFTGDTLFAGGVGRTDLRGGDMRALLESVRRLLDYPDEVAVYPGHGPPSTVGHEKHFNPFIK